MELNATVFIQLGIYLFILVVLKFLFFDPILDLLKRRDALTSGRDSEATKMAEELTASRSEYDHRLIALRHEMEKDRHDALNQLKSENDSKFNQAKAEVAAKEKVGHDAIEAAADKVRAQLHDASAEVAREIAKAILKSKVVTA